jgi:glycolate oxidase iron-sulfur subunit
LSEHQPISLPPSPDEPTIKLDERVYGRALDCVHCGLCLPACPTYTTNGLEADSPRGRIYLMKAMADGRIDATDSVVRHLNLCLDCRACEPACPSGVIYHELIEETRTELAERHRPSLVERIMGLAINRLFPYPTRLKLALLPVRLLQKARLWNPIRRLSARLLPAQLEKMQTMLPDSGPVWERRLAERYPARGETKMRVGFFTGCVGAVLFQDTNRRAVELLQHLGCEVVVPRDQACCGAIPHHAANPREAERMARQNIAAFEDVHAIVTDIAGCGAMLKDYDFLLRDDDAWRDRAERFVERMRDISELLVDLDPPKPPHAVDRTVTYHDACHLAHAQKITTPPRQLLAMVDGLEVRDLPESDMCCGAAGTYNLMQPAMARQLAERKLGYIRESGAGICVTGNVGCAMQIDSEARRLGMEFHVVHPVDLLHEAYFGT